MIDRQNQEFDRLLTVKEIAEILKISENTVKFWVSKRKFDVVRVGRLVRVPAEALREWIDENTENREKMRQTCSPTRSRSRKSIVFENFVESLKDKKEGSTDRAENDKK